MDQIISYIDKSVEDGYLSKTERKAIKAIIQEEFPNKRKLDLLRSQLFDLVREKIIGGENHKIIDWLENANKLLLPDAKPNEFTKVYFSPGKDCLNAILNEISYATKSIDICVFTISDDRIRDKLFYAQKKGIATRIITDNDKSFDRGSDIHSFAEKGIPVKIDSTNKHMHHKFAVIDKKISITGSYNWTRSAEAYNNENVLVTNDVNATKYYIKEFEKLWNKLNMY